MTVASALNRKEYTGDDATTSFATSPVQFFASSDLDVYAVVTTTGAPTLLTENTHYTVTGGAGAVGTVDTSGGSSPYGAPAATITLVIVRTMDVLQETDFVQNDASDAEVLEDSLDKGTMMIQQAAATLDRSFRFADSDVSGASLVVPTPTASSLVGWASDGLSLANYVLTDLTVSAVPAYALDILTAADDDAFFATMVDGMTAESTLAVGDLFAFVDVSLTPDDGRKCTVQGLFNAINVLTAETAPATGDSLLLYDTDGAAADKITLENVLKVVNSLTEDATPDTVNDFLLAYDASVSSVKKVKPENIGAMKEGTLAATTSGTAHDFTIPAGIKRVTISFAGVSLSGTDNIIVQLGDSGGVEATGYDSLSVGTTGGAGGAATSTAGFLIRLAAAAEDFHGHMTLTRQDAATFAWVSSHAGQGNTGVGIFGGGSKSLSAEATTVRVTRTGTDTFDAGSVNVLYER